MQAEVYTVPGWAAELRPPPAGRIPLGNLVTPIRRFAAPVLVEECGLDVWVKRDDATGFDVSGNKVRKLEFLLADAVSKGAARVVTIGGLKSNHCRATAVSASQIGLEPHVILRHPDPAADPGLDGNLGQARLAGARVRLVQPELYTRVGSDALVAELCARLDADTGNHGVSYPIPVGGSNWLGTWGYLQMVDEMLGQYAASAGQLGALPDHIVVACGSGGTLAGIGLGVRLARLPIRVTGVGVCDSPDYFYDQITAIATDLGVDLRAHGPVESWLSLIDGKGAGYSISTDAELGYIAETARRTGVVFDGAYSGKALYAFAQHARGHPDIYRRGQKLLFVHTGGGISVGGLHDRFNALLPKGQVTPLASKL